MTINIRYLLGIALLFSFSVISAQVRTSYTFEKGWKFTREDNADFIQPDYNDIKWQSVVVPHDWAIYGPFGIDNDRQLTAIAQDGQKEAMEHAGRTGGLPFVGVGWYRLNFDAPSFVKGKKATLIFDGAMSHARVYINGQEAGYWPYGYNTFYLDVTPYLKEGTKNTLAVRLENETESSRWYPGAGLYRNVHLVVTEDAHIPTWGTQLTTPVVKDDYAKVNIKTTLVVPSGKQFDAYRIVTELKDKDGKVITTDEKQGSRFDDNIFSQELVVSRPALWSPETPVLYQAVSKVYEGNILKDEYTTSFGIRTIEVIPNKGFFLNGKRTSFKGVCNHHDLGPLGGAVNDAAIRRQIRILKDMGCNAIRTSHNMPAPELIRACDEMGMMVMAESFDEWKAMKVKNGYRHVFDEWAVKDLTNLLRHYRNNPSVVMWCIGNEVPEQWDGNKGPKMSYFLQELCHREDPTRPVTQGMDAPDAVVNNNIDILVVGSDQCWRPLYNNYLDDMFLRFAEHLPIKKRIAYAASFGTDVWEYKESLTEKCAKLVKKFDIVTVREDSGVKLCKEYLCVNAFHVLDPTMLLQREDYLEILEKSNTPKSNGNLFDYILDPNPIKQQFVKNVASRVSLQSFHVLPKYNEDYRTRENVKKHLEECAYPSPLTWLAAFRDSKMTIVDSFHGMVFSIIFNVPFWVIGNSERGMSRFVSLLKIFGLEDRLISINDLNSMDLNRSIDWEYVNNILSIKRRDSYQILENALK